jgi:hypothetical protein
MWWGGGTILSRHLTPMVPFLALGLAWLPRRWGTALVALGIVSVLFIGSQSVVEPHVEPANSNAELYNPWRTVHENGGVLIPPYFSHSLPELLRGRVSMNPFNREIFATSGKGWTLLPLLAAEGLLLMALWRSVRREERGPRFRALEREGRAPAASVAPVREPEDR